MNTRIAPSPTGLFHFGTARTAYFNWLAARATGGNFVLRIDDTDADRNSQANVDYIYDMIVWLGLDCDTTFRQSDRLDRYRDVADLLSKNGYASDRDGAVYFDPNDLPTLDSWVDSIAGKIDCKDARDGIDKMVLMKSDGTPSYHFATVVDDRDYGIDWIIRGVDHISNTAKHKYIDRAVGIVTGIDHAVKYSHIGLIHLNNRKLSKRDDAAGLGYYRDKGYDPAAVLNAMLMLGWGHPDPAFDRKYPIVDKDLAVRLFMDGRLRNVSSKLDMSKLDWFNKKYRMQSI